MWSFYIPAMLAAVVVVLFVLRTYAAPSVPVFVRGIAMVGWITSISVIAIVPIDVWVTLTDGDTRSIAVMWLICYWTTQALSYLLIPLTQGFCDAGEFTFAGRLRASIRHNLTYYLSLGAAALLGVLALLVSGQLSWDDLIPLAMLLSNTYGLVAVVLLMGYGLVAIPRALWREANPDARLRFAFYRVGRAAEKLEDATFEMQLVANVVEATSQPMPRRDPLRPLMDIIYREADEQAPVRPGQVARDERGRVCLDDLADADLDYGADRAGLAALRRRMHKAITAYNALRAEYANEVALALSLEAVVRARSTGDYTAPLAADSPVSSRVVVAAAQAWLAYCALARPWVRRVGALAAGAASFLIVWSEATIGSGTHPDLSPFSHAIHAGARGEVATQMLVGAPLAYMATACYYTLARLGVFYFYRVVPGATGSHSLLMNASQVTRFAAPLAYNCLHVIRMHEYLPQGRRTVFAQKMSPAMADVPVFGTDFNTWFPLVTAVYCMLLFLNVWDRLARCCIPKRLRFDEDIGDDQHTERGRALLRQEQEARVRGQPIGECLGLWGSPESPGGSAEVRARNLAARDADATASSGDRGRKAVLQGASKPEAHRRSNPGGRASGTGGGYAGGGVRSGSGSGNVSGGEALPTRGSSPALTHGLLRNTFEANGSSSPGSLDDMFSRLAGGGAASEAAYGDLGRIDDQPSNPSPLSSSARRAGARTKKSAWT
ncbi:hypothetical protein WJX81_001086 [Elliptochloris bilobata]|uniref:LMBR1-like membrane protein n=1 Tax=Elliptochloris bilobata TaxID=381761 RepID=A0AAW1SBC4_9CHLO